jgi:hypothetical protein
MTTDEFDMLYVLETHGWSYCILYIGRKEPYTMVSTHIFNDPTDELLNALASLLQGEPEARFSWYGEPGEFQWCLTRDEQHHHYIKLEILDFSDNESTENRQLLKQITCVVKLKVLCICVMTQMIKIRKLMKENSYRKDRDFPEMAYLSFEQAFCARYE